MSINSLSNSASSDQNQTANDVWFKHVDIKNPESGKRSLEALSKYPETPQSLKDVIDDYFNELPFVIIDNPTFPKITSPTIALLEKIAAYYQKKYGIRIEICPFLKLSERLEELMSSKQEAPLGIIVTYKDLEGHLTPVLCNFTEGKKEILTLDTLGSSSIQAYKKFSSKLQENITVLIAYLKRQAGPLSCRTECTTILRNALLHIQREISQKTFIDLQSLTTPSIEPGRSKEDVLIPPEWDYTDQISNKMPGAQDHVAIRDLFSSIEAKRKLPRTVGQFRKLHTHKLEFIYSLNLRLNLYPISLSNIPSSEHLTITSTETDLEISWKIEKTVNTYLIGKSYHNARKVVKDWGDTFPFTKLLFDSRLD